MAPDYSYYMTQTAITPLRGRLCSTGSYATTKKVESKKAKRERIAKEKMYASWKTYDDKTETIKEIKQICKPRHKVNHMGRRY